MHQIAIKQGFCYLMIKQIKTNFNVLRSTPERKGPKDRERTTAQLENTPLFKETVFYVINHSTCHVN